MYSVLSHRIVVVFGGCPCVVVAWVVGGSVVTKFVVRWLKEKRVVRFSKHEKEVVGGV